MGIPKARGACNCDQRASRLLYRASCTFVGGPRTVCALRASGPAESPWSTQCDWIRRLRSILRTHDPRRDTPAPPSNHGV